MPTRNALLWAMEQPTVGLQRWCIRASHHSFTPPCHDWPIRHRVQPYYAWIFGTLQEGYIKYRPYSHFGSLMLFVFAFSNQYPSISLPCKHTETISAVFMVVVDLIYRDIIKKESKQRAQALDYIHSESCICSYHFDADRTKLHPEKLYKWHTGRELQFIAAIKSHAATHSSELMLAVKVSKKHRYGSAVLLFGSVSVWYCDNIVLMIWLGLAQKPLG